MTRAASLALPGIAAALLAFLLAPIAARVAVALGAMDMPGDRKIHDHPVPRLGGLTVVLSGVSALLLAAIVPWRPWTLPDNLALGIGLGLLPIAGISLVDDIKGVRPRYKFAAHTLGASIAAALGVALGEHVHLFGSPIYLGFLAFPISVLWLTGITNAFNIIDGLDGLSAGLALISALAMTAIFALLGQTTMAGASLVLSGALAGFLPYNTYPAKQFLGDTGAASIGFCLAAFSLRGGSTLTAGFAVLVPMFIVGLPLADTLVSMTRRVIRRIENSDGGPFTADRNHIHHRLLALGIDHGKAVLILYGVGVVLAAAGFVSVFMEAREAALISVALLVAGFVGVGRLGYDEFALLRGGKLLKVYDAPILRRSLFVGFLDLAFVIAAVYLAVGLKTDDWELAHHRGQVFAMAGLLAPLAAIIFWRVGLYKGSWRLASIEQYLSACSAATATAGVGLFIFSFSPVGDHYVTVFLIYGLISVLIVCGSRASYRIFFNTHQRASSEGMPVLICGASSRGARAVRELFGARTAGLKPVGFIDDGDGLRGRFVCGLRVFGGLSDVEGLLERGDARGVVISRGDMSPQSLDKIVEVCGRLNVAIFNLNVTLVRLSSGPTEAVPIVPITWTQL